MRAAAAAAAFVAALLVAGAGCTSDDDSSGSADAADRTSDVLAVLAAETIVPSYEDLVASFDALQDELDALCATPSAEVLAAARAAWRDGALAWQGTRGGAVGPAMDRRLMADVAFRARSEPVEDLLESDAPLDTAALAERGSTFRGLSMTEALLFGPTSERLTTSDGARACALLAATTPLSRDAVEAVLQDWTAGEPTYARTFAEGPEGDPLASVDALTNQVIASLTAIDDNGIRDLATAETLDDVLSTRRDGPAAFTMAEHRALLGSATGVVEGDPAVDGDGLVDLVEARSPDTAERLRDRTAAAVAAVEGLPDSVDAAFTDVRPALVEASEAVAALKVLLSTEVARQLGITVRFSDADGDS